ncbi:hypothetical protein CVV65_15100 [Kyrpidia spormannii]|uniref:Uncharacterized protein n=1 Tax=Kyrpidia spormannii TaxID=2055160 RepID=A0A2K8NBZ3_9BACL|nr:hypothetical protein CVV65_15100 [Kyrpidia spormannii]
MPTRTEMSVSKIIATRYSRGPIRIASFREDSRRRRAFFLSAIFILPKLAVFLIGRAGRNPGPI